MNPAQSTNGTGILPYEERLNRDLQWALHEGSMHFDKDSAVHRTLVKITRRLDELGIPYALAGGMAMFYHGYRRFTEDVDILITREALEEIHSRLEGLGYMPPFKGSKNVRDTESGVRIDFIVAGGYPGDGKPKPVTFPNPEDVTVIIDGVRCIGLPTLLELKITSGTAPHRLKDLADAQELIKVLNLGLDFADQLHPSVREKYRELWNGVQQGKDDQY
jgi:hypothetical protein